MIEAHLDESGVHDNAAVCVIGGYCGGIGRWKRFQLSWRKTFKEAGIPIEQFHAKDWIKRWDKSSVLQALAMAIGEDRIYPVSVGVVVADFNSSRRDC